MLVKPLVVNGLHRSGTTMLERLIDSQPNAICFNLFFQIIRAIAYARGFTDKGELMMEDFEKPPNVVDESNEFYIRNHFLTDHVQRVLWPYILQSNKTKEGDRLYGIDRADLILITEDIVKHENLSDIAGLLLNLGNRFGVELCATRWTTHHRYAPIFLKNPKAYWLEIIRNPYARLSSERISHKGDIAVVMTQQQDYFNFVSQFEHERYMVVKYENLCNETDQTLAQVSDWLGLKIENRDLFDINGHLFRPNTSDNRRRGKDIYVGDESMPARIGAMNQERWRSALTGPEIAAINSMLDFNGIYKVEPTGKLDEIIGWLTAQKIRFAAGLKNFIKTRLAKRGIAIRRIPRTS